MRMGNLMWLKKCRVHFSVICRSGSVSGPHASSSARNSSTSDTTASASHAAPSAACQDILAQQSKTAVEGDAGQGAHSTSNTAQHAEASQLEASGGMPFTSRVHLHSQVLCEDLHDEESPIPVRLIPRSLLNPWMLSPNLSLVRWVLQDLLLYLLLLLSVGENKNQMVPAAHLLARHFSYASPCICREIRSPGERRRTEACSPAL